MENLLGKLSSHLQGNRVSFCVPTNPIFLNSRRAELPVGPGGDSAPFRLCVLSPVTVKLQRRGNLLTWPWMSLCQQACPAAHPAEHKTLSPFLTAHCRAGMTVPAGTQATWPGCGYLTLKLNTLDDGILHHRGTHLQPPNSV